MVDFMLGSDAPVCSVCVANYNGLEVIGACLESVMAQEGGMDVEVIVHDDASTDGSADWIAERYPQVKILRSEDNVGFCVANNRMVDVARGEFVLVLNNDAFLFPDALSTLLAASQKGYGGILGLPQYDAANGKLIDRGCFLDLFYNAVPNRLPGDREVAAIIGACLWIPRRLWHALGGFPAWLHTLAEDTYLCQVARLGGYSVRVLDRSGFRHWVGYSLGGGKVAIGRLSTTYRRRAASERNRASVLFLCAPGSLLGILFPLLLLSLLLEGVAVSLAKRQWRVFREIYWPVFPCLWARRDLLAKERKRVQSLRRIGVPQFLAVISLVPYKLRMLFRYGLPELH